MRVALSLMLVLAAALGLPRPGDASKKPAKCSMRGSKTLVANGQARVFERYNRDGDQFVYACLYRSGRRFDVGDNPHDGGSDIEGLSLAGPYVAYDEATYSTIGVVARIERLNLTTGRNRFIGYLDTEQGEAVNQLLATRRGGVVWIGYGHTGNEPTVEKFDADGRVVLDSESGVEPGSLAVTPSGRRVYWSNDGHPRSAPLR